MSKEYLILFNSITDAIELLMAAQIEAEEAVLEEGEEG